MILHRKCLNNLLDEEMFEGKGYALTQRLTRNEDSMPSLPLSTTQNTSKKLADL